MLSSGSYKNRYDRHCPIAVDKGERTFPTLKDEKFHDLACAVIEQAVYDWIALDYGYWDRTTFYNGMIFSIEIRNFFQSKWFEFLLSIALPELDPTTFRQVLKVPEKEARQNA